MNFHPLLFAACLAAAAFPAHAQLSVVDFSSPPELVAKEALGGKPGMAVAAIWRGGKATYAGVDGATPLPASALSGETATLFEIGSISKVFTGLLLAQAVEAGDLSLDDTLGRLLQGKTEFASAETAAITLRQLVTHTSCLPRLPADFRRNYVREEPYATYDRQRMWTALGAQKLPSASPCHASYSNFGMAILGELLSERYGKPWETLVRERITQPLGMRNTMQTLGTHGARMAPAFSGTRRVGLWDFQAFAGAGALRSTPEDLLIFGRALLAGRNGPLGAAAERLLVPLARFDGDIGYGIFVRGPAERRTYTHTGGTGGYRAALVLAADTGEVVAAIASNEESSAYKVAADVLAKRYPGPAANYDIDPARLAEYSGVFREGRQSAWTFVPQDGQLHLAYTNQIFRPLTPAGPDAFNAGDRGRLEFERQAGRIVAVTWTGGGAVRRAPRSEEPVPAAAHLPQETLQAYVGRYRTSRVDFVVTAEKGQLAIQVTDQDAYKVYPVAGQRDRFAWDVFKGEAQFERYGNGQVKALVLHQNGVVRAERIE